MKAITMTIEVSAEQLAALSLLDARGNAREALRQLLGCVQDGVRRRGAWERGWLEQASGHEWQERLEPHPDEPRWWQRPRKVP